jgi:hypothetical protein
MGAQIASPDVLPGVLTGVQQLLGACLAASHGADASCRLLTVLLEAAAAQLPACMLLTLQQAAGSSARYAIAAAEGSHASSSLPGAAVASREVFAAQQALAAEAAAQTSCLCGLYSLGRNLATSALLRRAAPASSAAAAALEQVAALLVAGCKEGAAGDLVTASLCAAAAGGVVDGILASASRLVAGSGGGGGAAATLGLPTSHPLAASCMQLLAALARVCSRCSIAADSGGAGGFNAHQPAAAAAAGASGAIAAAAVAVAAAGLGSVTPQYHSSWQQQQSPGSESAAAVQYALVACASGCVGHAYATLLRTHGGVLPAQPTPGGLLCALSAVLDTGLSPTQLYATALGVGGSAAVAQQPTPPAATAVAQAAAAPDPSSLLEQEVGPLTRWIADWAATTPPLTRLRIAGRLHAAARRAAGGYSAYLAVAPAAALQGRQAAAVKNVLDKTFAVQISVIRSLWPPLVGSSSTPGQQQPASAADAHARAALAARLLAALSRLQFCRLQLPQYTDLVQALVQELFASEEAGGQLLAFAGCLYEEVVAASGGRGIDDAGPSTPSSALPSSLPSSPAAAASPHQSADPVLAASLIFLLPLLPVALASCRDPAASPAAAAAMPLVLLAVSHPIPQAALAAHSAFAAIAAACADRGGRAGELIERASPTYVRRSVEALPAAGSYEGAQLGLHFLWQKLPAGSGAALVAVARLCARAAALVALAAGAAEGAGAADGDEGGSSEAAAAAGQMFALLLQALPALDYQQLPAALSQVDALLRAVPRPLRREWLAEAQQVVLASQNVVTKPRLVEWLQAAAAAAGPRSKL